MFDAKALKARREAAKKERDTFQPLLDEAYQYTIPFRKSTKDTGTGDRRVDQVFDHTGIDAAFRFAGKMQQDFWPPGQENFSLEVGPVVVDPARREQLAKVLQLETVTKVAQSFFDDGEWDLSFHEMALDLSAGTGAILMNPSDNADELWEPISVPINELLLEKGRNNKICGIFWERRMSYRVLKETWPEGTFGRDLDDAIRLKPEQEVVVYCDTIYERRTKRWHHLVSCDKQDAIVYKSVSRTCPWLTPRYFRVPGETYGRGVSMLAMPTIKTANTAQRIMLQAAAIAMLGIYTAVDDGVFNPDLAPLEPGVFWKVARNGGTLGPSVNRFPDPRLDLSQMIVKDLQLGIKATMMDQSLPADTAAVKSATEIMERVKRLAADHVGAFGRLIKEITVPAVKRVIELAYERGLIADNVPIDQLLVTVKVKSPLAIAREAARIEKIIQWLQMVLAIYAGVGDAGGPKRIAKIDEALSDIGHQMGVPKTYINTVEERQKIADQQAQEQAALALAAGGATGAPA